MADPEFAAFAAKFKLETLEVARPNGWVLSVRPGQITLGAMVLSVQSGARDLVALDAQEAMGLVEGLAMAEALSRKVYGAIRINILCLMMQDPIVHFHILPRYNQPVDRHDRRWEDADWPGPPVIRPTSDDGETLIEIRDTLRDTLSGATVSWRPITDVSG